MNKVLWLLFALVVVIGIAFVVASRPDERELMPATGERQFSERSPLPTESTLPRMMAPEDVAVNMISRNNSGQTGAARLTDLGDGRTGVLVVVNSQPANSEQPAHIHVGTVENTGDIKYPLTPLRNGSSETVLNVPLGQIMGELPLVVNVHKSASEIETVVSAGDITPTGATGSQMTPPAPSDRILPRGMMPGVKQLNPTLI